MGCSCLTFAEARRGYLYARLRRYEYSTRKSELEGGQSEKKDDTAGNGPCGLVNDERQCPKCRKVY